MRPARRFTCVSLLLALTVIAVAPLRAGPDGETVILGPLGAKLDRIVQRSTGGGFWGAALVAKDGEVLLAKGYGFADYGSRPNAPDTLFEIASTSKPFTAAAVMRLAQQKKLGLDDSIGEHFEGVPEDKQPITVRHLLAHTSGISGEVGLPYTSRADRKELISHVLAAPLVSAPGEKFAYCNFGYALLAALVEEVSEQSFEDFMKAEVFGPAGLVDTGFIQDPGLDAARASARLSERMPGATAVNWHWGWGYRGMGGVVATIHDLYRFDRALRGGDVIGKRWRKAWYEPQRSGYALGWRVDRTVRGTTKVHHSGGVEGYAVNYVRFLEDDAVIVLLSNGRSNIHEVTKAIEDELFAPPRVTLAVDLGGYEINEHQIAELGDRVEWAVSKRKDEVRMVLRGRRPKHDVATITLPRGVAEKVLSDLTAVLDRGAGRGGKGTEAGLYLQPYSLVGGKVEVTDGLEAQVMARYEGRDEAGNRVVDERITVILVDRKRGQWPVMTKLDAKAAKRLQADLRKALK